mmetsp:Transcript_75240/g.135536  ORF Transcript_75240/g.135536 Transcript_75240/m.135536 type:complete len:299 (+) Transcript_75240:65-961(+)
MFGKSRDPSLPTQYFPGITSRRFDPLGANAAYADSLKKEKGLASLIQSLEHKGKIKFGPEYGEGGVRRVADMMPGYASLANAYQRMGWERNLYHQMVAPEDPSLKPGTSSTKPRTECATGATRRSTGRSTAAGGSTVRGSTGHRSVHERVATAVSQRVAAAVAEAADSAEAQTRMKHKSLSTPGLRVEEEDDPDWRICPGGGPIHKCLEKFDPAKPYLLGGTLRADRDDLARSPGPVTVKSPCRPPRSASMPALTVEHSAEGGSAELPKRQSNTGRMVYLVKKRNGARGCGTPLPLFC